MKNNMKFILFIVILIGVAVAIEYSLPKKFKWDPTFSSQDRNPFGSYVFDDILSSSLENGYEVANSTFYQLNTDSTLNEKRSVLSVFNRQNFTRVELEALLNFVEKGNKVMFIGSSFSYQLEDTLQITENRGGYYSFYFLRNNPTEEFIKDTLILTNPHLEQTTYEFYSFITGGFFQRKGNEFRKQIPEQSSDIAALLALQDEDSISNSEEEDSKSKEASWADLLPIKVLAQKTNNFPVALEVTIGEGKLYLLSTPLIFTNYGILDKGNTDYIFGLLSHIDDAPVIRLESIGRFQRQTDGRTTSPLRYFLEDKPLRWSLYLGLLCIVLLMIFSARRKQRIIPVITPPANKSLEFTELIATLYYQRKDYTDITRKKYIYFAEQLKRNTYIDIEAEELTMELCNRLANKTSMKSEYLHYILRQLQHLKQENVEVTEDQMKSYINEMNEILNNSR